MLTITETAPSVFNSSVFSEHRLSTIPDSFDGSLLTDMAPISNITLQKNDLSRSENLTSHKRRSIGSSATDVNGIKSATSKLTSSSGRKNSLSLNLFKHGISDVEDNISTVSPTSSLHSETSPQPLSIVTDYFNSLQISPQNYKLSKNKVEEKDFSENDEGDYVADDEELYNFFNDPLSPPSFSLTPFDNQVGGHTSFFRFSKRAVCKPLVRREHQFYEILEKLHPDLLPFVSQYLGVLNVTHRGELGSMPEVIFEQNKHLLPEWMLNKVNSSVDHDHNPDKENYDKGCFDDTNSQSLCTKVNKQLKEEVLCEVFSPKALRSYMTRRHSMINISNSEKPSNNTSEMSRSLTDIDHINPKMSYDIISNKSLEDYEVDNYNKESTSTRKEDNSTPIQHLKAQSATSSPKITSQILIDPPVFKIEEFGCSSSTRNPTTNPSSEKINNSWSMHCYNATQLSKLQNEVQQFVLLEDLTAGLKYPCVLDLKMGTRQYGIDASPEKRESQIKKCAETTSEALGVRICGMQVYKTTTRKFKFQSKYYGRSLNQDTFQSALEDFIHNGNKLLDHHIPIILRKLRRLAKIIKGLDNYRFYASSLLLIYDGDENNPRDIDIRIIDFAHCTTGKDYHPSECRYPPTKGFDRGYLLGLKNLCRSFETIYKNRCGIIPGNIGEEEEEVFTDIYYNNTSPEKHLTK